MFTVYFLVFWETSILSPCPASPCIHHIALCFCKYNFLDSTLEWYHTVLAFLWLISFRIMPSRSIYVVANGKISFSMLNHIHIHIYITSYLSIHLLMDTGCFHVLAMVNSAAANMGCIYIFELYICFHVFTG